MLDTSRTKQRNRVSYASLCRQSWSLRGEKRQLKGCAVERRIIIVINSIIGSSNDRKRNINVDPEESESHRWERPRIVSIQSCQTNKHAWNKKRRKKERKTSVDAEARGERESVKAKEKEDERRESRKRNLTTNRESCWLASRVN